MTYKDIGAKIQRNITFNIGSVTGCTENGIYTVYSYNTKIAEIQGDSLKYFNGTKHSTTTSRLQNTIRDVYVF